MPGAALAEDVKRPSHEYDVAPSDTNSRPPTIPLPGRPGKTTQLCLRGLASDARHLLGYRVRPSQSALLLQRRHYHDKLRCTPTGRDRCTSRHPLGRPRACTPPDRPASWLATLGDSMSRSSAHHGDLLVAADPLTRRGNRSSAWHLVRTRLWRKRGQGTLRGAARPTKAQAHACSRSGTPPYALGSPIAPQGAHRPAQASGAGRPSALESCDSSSALGQQ